MSELVLEPGQYALPEAIQPVDAPDENATNEEKATMLPKICRYQKFTKRFSK